MQVVVCTAHPPLKGSSRQTVFAAEPAPVLSTHIASSLSVRSRNAVHPSLTHSVQPG